jgi:hypothetical protein
VPQEHLPDDDGAVPSPAHLAAVLAQIEQPRGRAQLLLIEPSATVNTCGSSSELTSERRVV